MSSLNILGNKVTAPGNRQLCGQSSCECFRRKDADDRILRLKNVYEEYVDACEAERLKPYSFKTSCAKLLAWKRAGLAVEQAEWLPSECMLTYWSILGVAGKRYRAFVAQMLVSDATCVLRSDSRSPSDWIRCCECAVTASVA